MSSRMLNGLGDDSKVKVTAWVDRTVPWEDELRRVEGGGSGLQVLTDSMFRPADTKPDDFLGWAYLEQKKIVHDVFGSHGDTEEILNEAFLRFAFGLYHTKEKGPRQWRECRVRDRLWTAIVHASTGGGEVGSGCHQDISHLHNGLTIRERAFQRNDQDARPRVRGNC